jgi:hypothetical protein
MEKASLPYLKDVEISQKIGMKKNKIARTVRIVSNTFSKFERLYITFAPGVIVADVLAS